MLHWCVFAVWWSHTYWFNRFPYLLRIGYIPFPTSGWRNRKMEGPRIWSRFLIVHRHLALLTCRGHSRSENHIRLCCDFFLSLSTRRLCSPFQGGSVWGVWHRLPNTRSCDRLTFSRSVSLMKRLCAYFPDKALPLLSRGHTLSILCGPQFICSHSHTLFLLLKSLWLQLRRRGTRGLSFSALQLFVWFCLLFRFLQALLLLLISGTFCGHRLLQRLCSHCRFSQCGRKHRGWSPIRGLGLPFSRNGLKIKRVGSDAHLRFGLFWVFILADDMGRIRSREWMFWVRHE